MFFSSEKSRPRERVAFFIVSTSKLLIQQKFCGNGPLPFAGDPWVVAIGVGSLNENRCSDGDRARERFGARQAGGKGDELTKEKYHLYQPTRRATASQIAAARASGSAHPLSLVHFLSCLSADISAARALLRNARHSDGPSQLSSMVALTMAKRLAEWAPSLQRARGILMT